MRKNLINDIIAYETEELPFIEDGYISKAGKILKTE